MGCDDADLSFVRRNINEAFTLLLRVLGRRRGRHGIPDVLLERDGERNDIRCNVVEEPRVLGTAFAVAGLTDRAVQEPAEFLELGEKLQQKDACVNAVVAVEAPRVAA